MARKQTDSGAATGYEAELWAMGYARRGSMDAATAEILESLGVGGERT